MHLLWYLFNLVHEAGVRGRLEPGNRMAGGRGGDSDGPRVSSTDEAHEMPDDRRQAP